MSIRKIINFIPILFIRFYQKCISPLMPPACRFTPSCSNYGLRAFQLHPIHKAIWLTCWRILRCNPFNAGGYDPVPGDPDADPIDDHHDCDHDHHGQDSEKQSPTTSS